MLTSGGMGIKQGKALLEGPHPPQLVDFTGAAQEKSCHCNTRGANAAAELNRGVFLQVFTLQKASSQALIWQQSNTALPRGFVSAVYGRPWDMSMCSAVHCFAGLEAEIGEITRTVHAIAHSLLLPSYRSLWAIGL